MPVGTHATVKAARFDELERMGVRLLLANTYHLYLRPGMEVVEAAGGLHRFMGWTGNVLTDSGGFQIFSLATLRRVEEEGVHFTSHIDGSRHYLTPERVVSLQRSLGSDIIMPLDVCTPSGIEESEAAEACDRTTRWAERSRRRWLELDRPGSLFGIVQGNFFPALRRRSAAGLADLDLPGYAVGGLSVGESPEVFRETLRATAVLLPADRPRYVMGIGTPEYVLVAVEAGVDLFDCVYPTRTARNALALTRDGNLNLRLEANRLDQRPIDGECRCYTCLTKSRSYLRHLFKAREIQAAVLTTLHNLQFMEDLVEGARGAISESRFSAFKAAVLDRRARGSATCR